MAGSKIADSRFKVGAPVAQSSELIRRISTGEHLMAKFSEGSTVKWRWGNGYGHGTVQSLFAKKVTRIIDGTEVNRNGSEGDRACYVVVEDGNNVLKLESELEHA